ncbi:MAG TPA: nicotinamide riboside transporter PnuC [Allosphingosinicella sp.]
MTELEWIAAGLGVINVALVVRRSVWNYPFGLAMVALYFFVFYEARLYSDALLQIFFLVVQLYGWVNWVRARTQAGEVPVGWMTVRERVIWTAATIAASLVWGLGMARYTNAAAPVVDAFIAGFSISAQILMARRRIENWVLWILVDIVAVGLYFSRHLYPTSALYLLFLLLSVAGLVGWRRALPARPAVAVAA